MTTLMMLIDAFSASYLTREDAPYLHEIFQESMISLEPMFAFRGIEATVFTGLWPSEHGIWTEFRLTRTRSSSSKILEQVIRIADCLPHDKGKKAFRYLLNRFFCGDKKYRFDSIPSEYLNYFEPSLDRAINEPHSLGSTLTLFDILRQKGIGYRYITRDYFRSDSRVEQKVMDLLRQRSIPEFLYVKLGDLDFTGHVFGPHSSEIKSRVKQTDERVKRIVERWRQIEPRLEFLIFSDHGMSKVVGQIDLLHALRDVDYAKSHRDYVVFLDSTMARFWFFTPSIREKFEKHLEEISFGHILKTDDKKRCHLAEGDDYGELVFVLDEGYIFNPSFWHTYQSTRGMHGYEAIRTDEGRPIVIISEGARGKLHDKERLDFTDLFPLTLNLLD